MDEAVVLGVAHHFLDGGLYALLTAGVGVHDVPAGFPGILVPRAQLGLNCGRRQNLSLIHIFPPDRTWARRLRS